MIEFQPLTIADVAQSVVQLIRNQQVVRSSRIISFQDRIRDLFDYGFFSYLFLEALRL